MDNGFEDAFQYTVIGNSHNRLKSTNLLERLNQEAAEEKRLFDFSQPNVCQSINWSCPYGPS
ncbi:transposase [Enterococcus faecium]